MSFPKYICSLTVLILFIAALSGCNRDMPDPEGGAAYIASVGSGFEMRFNELHGYVRTRFYDRRYEDPVEAHLKALELLTDNQLKRIDFFDRGLHENDELLQPIRRTINEELVIEYFYDQFLGKHVNDDAIAEALDEYGREVSYRQIVLPKPDHENDHVQSREYGDIRDTVTEIRNRIDAGEDFSELASRYSRDQASSRLGGYMNAVNWKSSYDNAVYNAVFKLDKGDIQTIETRTAFHIVQVTDVTTNPVETEDQARQVIRQHLENVYVEFSQQEFETFRESLIDEATLKWNERALSQLLAWAEQPGFFQQQYRETFRRSIEDGNNFTIVSYDSGALDLREYLRLMESVLAISGSPSYRSIDLKNHILEALKNDKIVVRAREMGLEDRILQPYTRNPVLRNQLLLIYNDHIIGGQIPEPTEENLRSFYEMVKDTAYYQLQTVSASIIIADDEEQARTLLQLHESGIDFNDLAHEKQVRNFYRDRDGSLHTNHRTDQPDLANAAMKLELHEVDGPYTWNDPEKGAQPAIMKVVHIREEMQLEFEDVENRVKEAYANFHREKIEKRILADLRQKYPVSINRDLLVSKLRENGLIN